MKKKTGLLSLVLVGLLAFSQSSVISAAEVEVMDYTPLKIDNNHTIKKFSNGRVEPVENAELLSENQKNEILSEMGYTKKEIEELSDANKVIYITEGGKKVNLKQSDMIHKYFDLSGKEHIITPENEDEINKIKEADLKKLKAERKSTSGMGSLKDGIFTGDADLRYLGMTASGNEFKYSYRTHFNWSNIPWFTSTDRVGTSVQSHTTVIGSRGVLEARTANGPWKEREYKEIDQSNMHGTVASFLLLPLKQTDGTLYTEVRIPKAHRDYTGSFIGIYAHSYTDFPFSLNLGSLSVTPSNSFVGDLWTWRSDFMIGSSS